MWVVYRLCLCVCVCAELEVAELLMERMEAVIVDALLHNTDLALCILEVTLLCWWLFSLQALP